MPKNLLEYRFRDWMRLRPLAHALKSRRYRRIDRKFLAVQPEKNINSLRHLIQNRQTIVVIAYNDHQLIQWQSQLVRRFIPQAAYVVVDNSSSASQAREVQQVCCRFNVPYERLVNNPWSGRNASRSHALAMNWTWQHLLRPARPSQFGFIDHDLFPTAPTDPFKRLEDRLCWGDKRWAGERWFLWAGFCFFDFSRVMGLKQDLDFGLDWFAGLDTGGANWDIVYRHIDHSAIPERKIQEVAVWPDVPLKSAYFEWRDDWIHEVGLAGRTDLKSEKRVELARLLPLPARQAQLAAMALT